MLVPDGFPTGGRLPEVSARDPALVGVGVLAVEDQHVADPHHDVAARTLGDLGGERLLLFLELFELDLHKFVLLKSGIEGGIKRVGRAALAQTDHRLQALRRGFKSAEQRAFGRRCHGGDNR